MGLENCLDVAGVAFASARLSPGHLLLEIPSQHVLGDLLAHGAAHHTRQAMEVEDALSYWLDVKVFFNPGQKRFYLTFT